MPTSTRLGWNQMSGRRGNARLWTNLWAHNNSRHKGPFLTHHLKPIRCDIASTIVKNHIVMIQQDVGMGGLVGGLFGVYRTLLIWF